MMDMLSKSSGAATVTTVGHEGRIETTEPAITAEDFSRLFAEAKKIAIAQARQNHFALQELFYPLAVGNATRMRPTIFENNCRMALGTAALDKNEAQIMRDLYASQATKYHEMFPNPNDLGPGRRLR